MLDSLRGIVRGDSCPDSRQGPENKGFWSDAPVPLPGCYAAKRRHSSNSNAPAEPTEAPEYCLQAPHQATGRQSYAANSQHSFGAGCHRILGKCWKERAYRHQGSLGPRNYAAQRRHSSAAVTLQWAPRKLGTTWLLANSAAQLPGSYAAATRHNSASATIPHSAPPRKQRSPARFRSLAAPELCCGLAV